MRIGSLELQNDGSPARWIIDRIHEFAIDVGSVIPEGFEAYARLLHPAIRAEAGEEVPVRWSEIAADFAWTYVGGSEALIRAILADPELESMPTRIHHGVTYEADRINPLPADAPRAANPDQK